MPTPYRLTEIVPPTQPALNLGDVKIALRINHMDDDALLLLLIDTARSLCENFTGLATITRRYILTLDRWPAQDKSGWWDGVREGAMLPGTAPLSMPKPPLRDISEIRVYDADYNYTSLQGADYFIDTNGLPGRIVPKNGVSINPGLDTGGIQVEFSAGYGDTPEDLPAALRQGMQQMVAYLYENRGDDPGNAVEKSGALSILQPFRMMRLA